MSAAPLSPYSPAAAKDTIAAVATPPGRGGVGIIRISGSGARHILSSLFRPSAASFVDFAPRFLHHGHYVDPRTGTLLDEGLAVFMPGPQSFTGEDVAELHGHGSPAALGAIMEAVMAVGARQAERGEFSYRAFLHGRMDLSQAEAIAELRAAPSPAAARFAHARLGGELGRRAERLRVALLDLRAYLCLAVDFPDDEVECLPPEEFLAQVGNASRAIEHLLNAHERSKVWQAESRVVLAGRVNAGKSSLMNALLGRERALVSDIPGTTRDYLEESINLGGLVIRLVDTAGLRETGDSVEIQGMAHSRSRIEEADAVLLVIDAGLGLAGAEHELLNRLGRGKKPVLVIFNKIDAAARPVFPPSLHCVAVSAKTGQGLDALAEELRQALLHGRHGHGQIPEPEDDGSSLAPNERQAGALRAAHSDLRQLADALAVQMPYDIVAVHLDAAVAALAEIIGIAAPADVLERVFNEFCIGK
jgi:tRNA modification GTPase